MNRTPLKIPTELSLSRAGSAPRNGTARNTLSENIPGSFTSSRESSLHRCMASIEAPDLYHTDMYNTFADWCGGTVSLLSRIRGRAWPSAVQSVTPCEQTGAGVPSSSSHARGCLQIAQADRLRNWKVFVRVSNACSYSTCARRRSGREVRHR